MELHFVGDIHGQFKAFKNTIAHIPEEDTIIQVGDFGLWPHLKESWLSANITRKVYFIDGNHDHHPSLLHLKEETEIWPNAIYIPRGTVWVHHGKTTILFLGGAGSVDYKWRHRNIDYFPDLEEIRQEDIDKIPDWKFDLIVSHTPPRNCIDECFDPAVLENFFGISRHWKDRGSILLEDLHRRLDYPKLICGHMHRSLKWNNVRILGIHEVLKWPNEF